MVSVAQTAPSSVSAARPKANVFMHSTNESRMDERKLSGKCGFHISVSTEGRQPVYQRAEEEAQLIFVVSHCQVVRRGQAKTRKRIAAVKGRPLLSYGEAIPSAPPLSDDLDESHASQAMGESTKKEEGAAGQEIRTGGHQGL